MPGLPLFDRLQRHLLREYDKANRGEPSGFSPDRHAYPDEPRPVYTLTLPKNNVVVLVCMDNTVHWFGVTIGDREVRLVPGREPTATQERTIARTLAHGGLRA